MFQLYPVRGDAIAQIAQGRRHEGCKRDDGPKPGEDQPVALICNPAMSVDPKNVPMGPMTR